MSLENEIQIWIKSEEFLVFYNTAEYAMALVLDSDISSTEHIQEHIIKMGRHYNHFLFCITEKLITQAKQAGINNHEDIALATSQFIMRVEKQIAGEFPLLFTFFSHYRQKVNPS